MVQNIIMSLDEARRVCEVDNVNHSDDFVQKNVHQCYYACNAWLCMALDMGVYTPYVYELRECLCEFGLAQMVEAGVSMSEGLLEGLAQVASDSNYCQRWAARYATHRGPEHPLSLIADQFCNDGSTQDVVVKRILQFFLFLERFTYYDRAEVQKTYDKFLQTNRRCKQMFSAKYRWDSEISYPGETLLSWVREELAMLFDASAWDFSPLDRSFSAGSNSDAGRDYAAKWVEVTKYFPGYKALRDCALPVEETWLPIPENVPTLMAVPKTMTSKRIIAPENVLSSWNSSSVLEGLRRMNIRTGASSYINEEDQTINRDHARVGSLTGEWATIDMSSASDSISKTVFFDCLPSAFSYVYRCLTSHWCRLRVDGVDTKVRLHSLLTSGNRCTWLTEAMWFVALGRVGTWLAGGSPESVFAYGDDLIVPSGAYETVCEVLEALGHTVNRRKSYGSGCFRESCGGWYFQGVDVTPTFWPRRVVLQRDCLEVLCHLQRAFFHQPMMRTFFEECAVCLNPRISHSPYGDECDDLWDLELLPEVSDRVKHWHPKERHLEHDRTPLIEAVTYFEYLEYGPLYLDGLDELVGVSSSRLDRYYLK
jgi:hypothetical protein